MYREAERKDTTVRSRISKQTNGKRFANLIDERYDDRSIPPSHKIGSRVNKGLINRNSLDVKFT